MRAIHAVVTGRVHGVGFRFTVERAGRRLGLQGWVANRPDGSVEAFAQGEAAAVDTMIEVLETGPRNARVLSAAIEEVTPDDTLTGFDTRF